MDHRKLLRTLQNLLTLRRRLHRFISNIPSPVYFYGLPALVYLMLMAHVARVAGPDLWPAPDAIEYALLTDRLIHAEPPRLAIGPHEYPARYALVYPIFSAIPAKIIEWLTALQHRDYSYLSRLYWVAMLFGLASVLLMARVGGWLTGSRWGGLLGALFFASHPALQRWAAVNMGETMLIMLWLALLEVLRPWLQGHRSIEEYFGRRNLLLRAAGGGLLAGLLTIAKAPFIYWAVAGAFIICFHARRSRNYSLFAAFIGCGLLMAAGEGFYRHWAFGGFWKNGYAYWFPEIYESLSKTFNFRYLFHAADGSEPGNLVYYGRLLLGHKALFFTPQFTLMIFLALTGIVICYSTRFRRSPLPALTAKILGGWLLVGILFCSLYFFQNERFPLIWTPLLDLLPAWLLVQLGREGMWSPTTLLRRFAWRAIAVCFSLILFNQQFALRRIESPNPGNQPAVARSQQMIPLLQEISSGDLLFTNYQLPLVQRLRPGHRSCGTLYAFAPSDRYFNGHAYQILKNNLIPFKSGRQDGISESVAPWNNTLPHLFDLNHDWSVNLETLPSPFYYVLVVAPPYYPTVGNFWRETIEPRLLEHSNTVKPIRSIGDMTLYRVQPRVAWPPRQ